jgi:hypothetical protein
VPQVRLHTPTQSVPLRHGPPRIAAAVEQRGAQLYLPGAAAQQSPGWTESATGCSRTTTRGVAGRSLTDSTGSPVARRRRTSGRRVARGSSAPGTRCGAEVRRPNRLRFFRSRRRWIDYRRNNPGLPTRAASTPAGIWQPVSPSGMSSRRDYRGRCTDPDHESGGSYGSRPTIFSREATLAIASIHDFVQSVIDGRTTPRQQGGLLPGSGD